MAKNEIKAWIAVVVISAIIFIGGYLAGSIKDGNFTTLQKENNRLKILTEAQQREIAKAIEIDNRTEARIKKREKRLAAFESLQREAKEDYLKTGSIIDDFDRVYKFFEEFVNLGKD